MEERPWRPQKRWGQSFLHDGNIIRKIVSLADLDGHETVVEIGPGRGALTSVLVSRVGRLVLLEIDPQLVSWLTGEYGQDPRVEIVAGDVLACDLRHSPHGSAPSDSRWWGIFPIASRAPSCSISWRQGR